MIWKILYGSYLLIGLIVLAKITWLLCNFIEAATNFLRHWSKPLNININNKTIEVSEPAKETKEMIQ